MKKIGVLVLFAFIFCLPSLGQVITGATIISAPVRPKDSAEDFPVAYQNEIAGGLHAVETKALRDSISVDRRVRGMLCYVWGIDTTYQLVTGITNSDWEVFTVSTSTTTTEMHTFYATSGQTNFDCSPYFVLTDTYKAYINGALNVHNNSRSGNTVIFTDGLKENDEVTIIL